MKISEISPVLYGSQMFDYTPNNKTAKISVTKSQYVYRYIYISAGNPDFYINRKKYELHEGSVIYLTPGDIYYFDPKGKHFSLIGIFFDFITQNEILRVEKVNRCILSFEYDSKLNSSPIQFDDTTHLSCSGVFNCPDSKHYFQRLLTSEADDEFKELYEKNTISSITYSVLRSASEHKTSKSTKKIMSYIKQHINEEITPKTLSLVFGYHPNHINHIVKKQTGFTLTEYIRKSKIEQAIFLLSETDTSLTEAAQILGYYDYSHFFKAFVKETGKSPSDFLKNI